MEAGLKGFVGKAEIALRSKQGALWVSTKEELRASKALEEVAARLKCEVVYWSSVSGFGEYNDSGGVRAMYQVEEGAERARELWGNEPVTDLYAALEAITKDERRAMYVFFDTAFWYAADYQPPEARLMRRTVELLHAVRRLSASKAKALCFIDSGACPSVPGFVSLPLPLPTRQEAEEIVELVLRSLPNSDAIRADFERNGTRAKAINALVGLEAESMSAAIRASVVANGRIDADYLLQQKKAIIAKAGFVQWIDADEAGLDNIGGNENFKAWLADLFPRFSEAAREYGLMAPKACLVAGIPGTGKSATFKALGASWKMPLLRVMPFESKFVGESQSNLMQVFNVARAVSPCIVLWDECEKTFGGADSDSSGVTQKVLGILLTEMQEEKGGVFHYLTCNDPTRLKGELFRRCDGIFWCDLPSCAECEQIVRVMQKRYKRASKTDVEAIAKEAVRLMLTGAEIEKAFQSGMARAFADGARDTGTQDIVSAMKDVVPVIRSYEKRIAELRTWAKEGARNASKAADVPKTSTPILGDAVLM